MSEPVVADLSRAERPVPWWRSLRAQGWLATGVLAVYLVASAGYVARERHRIDASVQTLNQVARHEKALALAESAVAGAVVDVNVASNAASPEPAMPEEITLYMESCAKLFAALDEFDPGYALIQRPIVRSYDELKLHPVRASWIDLRESLSRAADELEIRRATLLERRDALMADYQHAYDAVTTDTMLLAGLGVLLFAGATGAFLARLGRDIRRLEVHARDIVRGRRGQALPVRREDELGRLMHAVNRMSADLDERERQIALDGERRAYQDKMIAVGALAAGVAHEVNNPLAAVVGAAQALKSAGDAPPQQVADSAQLILAEAQRAAHAARQLAELAAPPPEDFDWIDLNGQLRRVVQLAGYDKRYRRVPIETHLDPQLPALRAPGAAVQQVLMQMLSLGCDALAAQPWAATAPVRIATSHDPAAQRLEVVFDFPVPIDLSRADVQRALLLSRATLESLGARLAFGQAAGDGVRIQWAWPAPPAAA